MAVGPSDVAFRDSQHVGTHTFILMTGLIPFTLTHCGPSPPWVRFAAGVTDYDATLGTRCLAKASGAGAFPRLTKPNFARRTRNGEIVGASVIFLVVGADVSLGALELPRHHSDPLITVITGAKQYTASAHSCPAGGLESSPARLRDRPAGSS